MFQQELAGVEEGLDIAGLFLGRITDPANLRECDLFAPVRSGH